MGFGSFVPAFVKIAFGFSSAEGVHITESKTLQGDAYQDLPMEFPFFLTEGFGPQRGQSFHFFHRRFRNKFPVIPVRTVGQVYGTDGIALEIVIVGFKSGEVKVLTK